MIERPSRCLAASDLDELCKLSVVARRSSRRPQLHLSTATCSTCCANAATHSRQWHVDALNICIALTPQLSRSAHDTSRRLLARRLSRRHRITDVHYRTHADNTQLSVSFNKGRGNVKSRLIDTLQRGMSELGLSQSPPSPLIESLTIPLLPIHLPLVSLTSLRHPPSDAEHVHLPSPQ